MQGERQTLATEALGHIHAKPAGLAMAAIGIGKAGGGADPAIDHGAAFSISRRVERLKHPFGKFCCLLQNGAGRRVVAIRVQLLEPPPAGRDLQQVCGSFRLSCKNRHGSHFGCMRIAPSRRMTSALRYWFSMQKRTASAYSEGSPRREG